jgi:phenylacetate-CoA ligase
LAKLPVLRKADLVALQKESPPFGGLNVTAPGKVRRLWMSPGPVFEPEGKGEDVWGTARALFAAGFRPGEVVHNSFSYHLTPGGFIMESGARALGCAVIPAGTGNTEQLLEAIAHFKPSGYLGTPDFLKVLLDAAAKAGKDASSLKHGLVSGAALPASLRQELTARGVTCSNAVPPPISADRVRAKRAKVDRRQAPSSRSSARTGDPVAEGEVDRGRRHGVQPGLSDDPPRDRRPVRGAAGTLALRAQQYADQRLDGARRSVCESKGHVRASRRHRRGEQAAS